MLTLDTIYDADEGIDNEMEILFTNLIATADGQEGDSGWGCGERDRSATFDDITIVDVSYITAKLLLAGFASVAWRHSLDTDEEAETTNAAA